MTGTIMANEALLTGETTPSLKETVRYVPFTIPPLTLKESTALPKDIIFAGTEILDSSCSSSVPCIGIVIAISGATYKGILHIRNLTM